MQHFYDGQIRRYITQIMRIFGTFQYKDGKGNLTTIPITYGDLTRQVGSVLRDNSENKVPSAPRMAVYITGLEMDTSRLSDSSFVSKLNIRERAFDENNNEYLNKEGKNYTVERLMPTPYTLSVSVDLWTTNTDQKLQILEQIMMLFNPSLELQTTENYIDWTSISVLNIDNINFSSRSIPTGTESEIDVATIGLQTPIFISPPAKVKKLGVITNIITAVFADSGLEVNIDETAYAQSLTSEPIPVTDNVPNKELGKREELTSESTLVTNSYQNYDLVFLDGVAKLLKNGKTGAHTWTSYVNALSSVVYEQGISELKLQRSNGYEISGTVTINTADETELLVTLDEETIPTDTPISGPNGSRTSIDYIIDPANFDPRPIQTSFPLPRLLLLGNVGHAHIEKFTTENTIFEIKTGIDFDQVVDSSVYVDGSKIIVAPINIDDEYVIRISAGISASSDVEYVLDLNQEGPTAWKNSDGSDFTASANDIVEWDGSRWNIVFDASVNTDEVFTTNLNTLVQYRWTGAKWILAYEGEYPDGTWRLI